MDAPPMGYTVMMTNWALFRMVALASCGLPLVHLASAQSTTNDKSRSPLAVVQLKEQLRSALKQTKIQQARQDYYKRLREKAEVSVLLSAPKVDVKADPGRLRGDAKAPLTIVEFSDFQCPYCQGVQATLKA